MQIPQDLIETAALKLKSIQTEAEFFQLRAKFLGKKSFVASSFSKLRDLKPEEKVIAAKELNILKNNLTQLFETALAEMEDKNNYQLNIVRIINTMAIGVNTACLIYICCINNAIIIRV